MELRPRPPQRDSTSGVEEAAKEGHTEDLTLEIMKKN
jgi:hypothetical protein